MRYQVKALRPGAGVTVQIMEAIDKTEATTRLQREGAQVLSIVAVRYGWLAARRARFPLMLFTQELIALLDAGLTLTESLETLAEKESRPESRQLIERNPDPSDDEIRHSLEGNLCRCTGYQHIVNAVRAAAAMEKI